MYTRLGEKGRTPMPQPVNRKTHDNGALDNDSAVDNQTPTSRRAFLSVSAASAAVGVASVVGGARPAVAAQTVASEGPGTRATAQVPDHELQAILREIDQDRIEAIVRKLVSFGTRHTLSSQDDPVRGIGAARDWIFAQMSE